MRELLRKLPQSRDVAIGLLLFVVVLLMILPMPTVVVDGLIALNFGIAVLLLMTGIYLPTPLSLSSLPGIILISTIFRLSLSVTTTRLILANGDAGDIVETFGAIVVAGNVVVGLVVFFIVTVVQFIVIAKGAERIAEVGARFTLDALPGKQMSIDAELRNGDIDNVEAGRRRKLLERESQFYGAMDGAMKFVKGDAVAGIIIIFVNLIGGLVIGIVQFGMPFAAAAHKYSLLTVGDALISQIPALLISVTAAVIVTRVKGEEQRNLGADIFSQIASDRRSLRLTGAALVFMGLLPGFPTAILAGLGTLFLVAGFAGGRLARLLSGETAPAASEADGIGGGAPARGADAQAPQAVIEMPPAMAAGFAADELGRRIEAMAAEVAAATGLPPFRIAVAVRDTIADPGFRLLVEDEPVMWSRAPAGIVTLPDIPEVLRVHDIPFRRQTTATWTHRLEVAVEHLPALEAAGIAWRDRADMVFADATEGLIKNAAALVGLQETRELLTQAEAQAPVLVAELTRAMPIQRIAEVFRRLLEERVSLRHRRRILEALVEWAPTESNPLALTEYCRIALKRQVCEALSHDDRQITAIVVERDTEEILRASLRDTNIGSYLVLSEDQTQDLLKAVQGQVRTLAPRGIRPAIITSFDVRRHLKTFLTRNSIEIEVISFQELCDDYTAVPCSTLALKQTLRAPADTRRLKPPTRGDAPP